MDLRAGDPLVVEVTAPDAEGGTATSFALLGPGRAGAHVRRCGRAGGSCRRGRAIEHEAVGGEREVHGGLSFIAWSGIRTTAPPTGSTGSPSAPPRTGRPASTCSRPAYARSSGSRRSAAWPISSPSSMTRGRRAGRPAAHGGQRRRHHCSCPRRRRGGRRPAARRRRPDRHPPAADEGGRERLEEAAAAGAGRARVRGRPPGSPRQRLLAACESDAPVRPARPDRGAEARIRKCR